MWFDSISFDHVIKAIEEIDAYGFPPASAARGYFLCYKGSNYPPKYTISLAYKYLTGREKGVDTFSSGKPIFKHLIGLGFEVIPLSGGTFIQATTVPPIKTRALSSGGEESDSSSMRAHRASCSECKNVIYDAYRKKYGQCKHEHQLAVHSCLDIYTGKPYYEALKKIHDALVHFNNGEGFVRARSLDPMDFFCVATNQVIELDESQHFTEARALSLENYPPELPLGFDRTHWIQECKRQRRVDKDPPYRDPQRAWYDTLRDFLPWISGLGPTVRIQLGIFKYCDLSTDTQEGIDSVFFHIATPSCINRQMLTNTSDLSPLLRNTGNNVITTNVGRRQPESTQQKESLHTTQLPIEFHQTSMCNYGLISYRQKQMITRLIHRGNWTADAQKASILLEDIADLLVGGHSEFLITCGGFITEEWPTHIKVEKYLSKPARETLMAFAQHSCQLLDSVLSLDLMDKLMGIADFVTLGIDYRNGPNSQEIELVMMLETHTGRKWVTGKFYPITEQQGKLILFRDMASHFIDTGTHRVMLLGCHDLNAFSNRATANAKRIKRWLQREMHLEAKKNNPDVVLQHPHTTDSKRTWLAGISGLRELLHSVQHFASAGRYFNGKQSGAAPRDDIGSVLSSTQLGDVASILCEYLK